MPVSLAQIRRSAFRLVIVAAVVVLTSGCSFTGVKGPPPGHQTMTSFYCTESRVLPIIDLIGAVNGFSLMALRDNESGWFEYWETGLISGVA